ncbi:hypothetical protein WBK31_24730 [Nonomuraea sp. N2-4H]|uniref:hypothetical protein n=1 Tax=Nonomuraea sp. N2-4H TaxID=3128898 RepID=UPI00324431DE
MTDYWVRALKDPRVPQIDGTLPQYGEAESSDDISNLIQSTKPDKVAEAGRRYTEIAEMCAESVETLHREAARIAETLGGESLEGIFEKIGELQRDLGRLSFAAQSVGQPLIWYGRDVLPWFHNNVPRTGSVDLDDWMGDVVGTDTNAHALARHHLQQLNRFIQDVYHSIGDHVEQRATAPATGMPDFGAGPGLGLGGGLTENPYKGFGSTPDLGDGLPGSGVPDMPDYEDPSLRDPSIPDPSLQDPSSQDPSSQNPGLENPAQPDPSQQNPDMRTPSSDDPALRNPGLPNPGLQRPEPQNPALHQAELSNPATNLSSLPNANVPAPQAFVPGTPTGSGPTVVPGSVAATGLGSSGLGGSATPGAAGLTGGPMGMIPPLGGAAGAGQERERERMKMPLTEYDPFDSDDLGGPPLIT